MRDTAKRWERREARAHLLLSKTEWITATDARLRRFVAKVKAIGGEMRRLTSVFAVVSSRCVGYYGSHVED